MTGEDRTTPRPTGWVLMGSPSRGKYHWVNDTGRSLCRKWGAFDWQPREQGNDGSPDNCAECKRRRTALEGDTP